MFDLYRRLLPIVMVVFLAVLLSVLGFFFFRPGSVLLFAVPFLAAVLAVVSVLWSILLVEGVRRHPKSLSIALLGHSGVGKTVFLSVLFDELQRVNQSGFGFTPYGSETIESVSQNLGLIARGKWLPPTQLSDIFAFRANAYVGSGFFKTRFRLEIADYAGEHTENLAPKEEMWLHKSKFFQYVVQSDALMIALDAGTLIKAPSSYLRELEDSMIAAFNLMLEGKDVEVDARLKAPVALLFLKADIAGSAERAVVHAKELGERVPRLMSICRRRCRNFECFAVSSVGKVSLNGLPPEQIHPFGVTEPLIWLLSRIRNS